MLLALSKPLLYEKDKIHTLTSVKILTKLLVIFNSDFSFSHKLYYPSQHLPFQS